MNIHEFSEMLPKPITVVEDSKDDSWLRFVYSNKILAYVKNDHKRNCLTYYTNETKKYEYLYNDDQVYDKLLEIVSSMITRIKKWG